MNRALFLLTLVLTAHTAQAAPGNPYAPPLGPRPTVVGPRSQVLTLGTPHLATVPGVTAAMLDPLIANLARFAPTVITHEGLSGEQCDFMRRAPRYKDAVDTYCWDPAPAQKLANMTLQQAEVAIDDTLAGWAKPGRPTPTAAERRHLAFLFLAAGDRASAVVQWLRLAPTERIAADGLDEALVEVLVRKGKPLHETYAVASVLAARLGLDRVYAVDDHSSDGALSHVSKAYETALTARFARGRGDPVIAEYQAMVGRVKDAPSLLALYRYLTNPVTIGRQIESDMGAALADKAAAPYGRQYVAWWEIRNLRMVANWRAAFADQPGARVLNIVGSSHKPWYDAWARQMSDVEVVALAPYLR